MIGFLCCSVKFSIGAARCRLTTCAAGTEIIGSIAWAATGAAFAGLVISITAAKLQEEANKVSVALFMKIPWQWFF
jgi:hypothetical protein